MGGGGVKKWFFLGLLQLNLRKVNFLEALIYRNLTVFLVYSELWGEGGRGMILQVYCEMKLQVFKLASVAVYLRLL